MTIIVVFLSSCCTLWGAFVASIAIFIALNRKISRTWNISFDEAARYHAYVLTGKCEY